MIRLGAAGAVEGTGPERGKGPGRKTHNAEKLFLAHRESYLIDDAALQIHEPQ